MKLSITNILDEQTSNKNENRNTIKTTVLKSQSRTMKYKSLNLPGNNSGSQQMMHIMSIIIITFPLCYDKRYRNQSMNIL